MSVRHRGANQSLAAAAAAAAARQHEEEDDDDEPKPPAPPRRASTAESSSSTSGYDELASCFAFDLRWLAVSRILVACVALHDVWTSSGRHFLTDAGILPRYAFLELTAHEWYYSLYVGTGNVVLINVMLAMEAAAAVCFMVGYKTRVSNAIMWLSVISRQARNTAIGQGGDVAYRLVLLYFMMLPMGAALSVDTRTRGRALRRAIAVRHATVATALVQAGFPPAAVQHHQQQQQQQQAAAQKRVVSLFPRHWVVSMASCALAMQVACIYFFSAVAKQSSRVWTTDGTALAYALHYRPISTAWCPLLLQYPGLLQLGTRLAHIMEYAAPALLLCPCASTKTAVLRCLSIAILATFHVTTAFMMQIGIFPWIMLAVLPVFLPTKLMDVCEQAITRCFGRTATDSASTGRRRSRHRHRHTPVLGTPRQATFLSTTGNVVAWILLMLGVTWNVLNHVPLQPVADYLNPVVSVVRVDQVWSMFTPQPPADDGWWVMPGKLRNGREVDLFGPNGGPISRPRTLATGLMPRNETVPREQPPGALGAYFASDRWRKYYQNINREDWEGHRLYYGRYICSVWNGDLEQPLHPHHLLSFEITFELEDRYGDSYKHRPRRTVVLWSHACFDEPGPMVMEEDEDDP